MERSHDPRDRLVREKYFSLRPKPLERWLWQQSLPASAERVFWLHWEQGMRNRDWCSEIPVRRVASECHLDVSTVSRAYQLLRARGLIRREDPGRDPANPFQQATAITEVRVPRELLVELDRHPSRARRSEREQPPPKPAVIEPKGAGESASLAAIRPAAELREARKEIQAKINKLSHAERERYYAAFRERRPIIAFDPDTTLTPDERGAVLANLEQMANSRIAAPERPKCVQSAPESPPRRRLSPLEIARARRAIGAAVPTARDAAEALRQVIWAVEEGALRQFQTLKGLNIALKKIREGAWTRPNRMPPNWLRVGTASEVCSAA
jgi:DNA-binding Lrp family transcriptional regulator